MENPLCACGCGEEIATTRYYDYKTNKIYTTRFMRGHHMRVGRPRTAAKLTQREVLKIKHRLAQHPRRMTIKQMARFYGVSESCIASIRRGATWRDVTLEEESVA